MGVHDLFMKIQSTCYLRAFNFFEYLEKIKKNEGKLRGSKVI